MIPKGQLGRTTLMAAALMLSTMGLGQRTPPAPITGPPMFPGEQQSEQHDRDQTVRLEERQAKQRNDERQRRLVSDTEKLLTLATALHEDVAKTNKNVLSLDVIRRADEIERLAHGVKERMKG